MDGRENRAGSSARHVGRALKKKRRSNVAGSGRRAQPDHKKTRGSQVRARDVALPAERAGARRPGRLLWARSQVALRWAIRICWTPACQRRRGSPGNGTTCCWRQLAAVGLALWLSNAAPLHRAKKWSLGRRTGTAPQAWKCKPTGFFGDLVSMRPTMGSRG